MEYEFNDESSYTLPAPEKDFICIGTQGHRFIPENDIHAFIIDELCHEHMHKAIEKVTDTETCTRFDFICDYIQYYLFPGMAQLLEKQGYRKLTHEEITRYYTTNGLL